MNAADDRTAPISDATIDRLVDGDLGEAERRELLLRLENDPEGWRRCALAFLEDQAWRRAIVGAAGPPAHLGRSIDAPNPPRRSRARRLSIAASVIAATFAAGFAAGEILPRPGRVEVARAAPPEEARPTPPTPADQIREVGWIDLVDSEAGEAPPRRVPILSGPGLDDRWLRDRPPTVPAYVKAQYERQGYQVEERRRLVSVVLGDGRTVSIPVDEVAVEYVGQHSF